MSLYIYRVVIDANIINAKGQDSAMNELESLFGSGIIQILKTSALNIEFTDPFYTPGLEKAKSYDTLYGPNWIGHTEGLFSGGERSSNIEMIYKTLWGKVWMEENEKSEKIRRNNFRDAVHLDICWMNNIDYFVTRDEKIINRDKLYEQGFDVKVVTPEECLASLNENFIQDIGTNDPAIILKRIKNSFPIFLGSNDCENVFIRDNKTGETLFRTHWIDGQLHIEANIYDSDGNKIVQIKPKTTPVIFHESGYVTTPNSDPEQYLRIDDCGVNYFSAGRYGEVFLIGRILPSGHIVFQGKFFNSSGELVAEIEKKVFKHLGVQMSYSQSQVLPFL